MDLNVATARAILDEAHRAWSAGDLEGVLRTYNDDISYQCNSISAHAPPVRIEGRDGMRAFLEPIAAITESMSVLEDFRFHSGIGRARVSCYLKHRATGHILTTSYRQVVMFRNQQISHMEEFHDATKLAAFFKLIESEAQKPIKAERSVT